MRVDYKISTNGFVQVSIFHRPSILLILGAIVEGKFDAGISEVALDLQKILLLR